MIRKSKWYLTRWNPPNSAEWQDRKIMFSVWGNQPFETKRAAMSFCKKEISDAKPVSGRKILLLSSHLYTVDELPQVQ